jgi:hypothetical protein
MLNLDQLEAAVATAQRQFSLMRKKFPKLKARLVLSLPGGQTGIDSSPIQILSEFQGMVVDDSAKVRALDLLSRISESPPTMRRVPGQSRRNTPAMR